MDDPEKELRFIKDSIRLLKDDVETTLLSRGWAVTDLDVGDEEPREWFWPPTAPVGVLYQMSREHGEKPGMPRPRGNLEARMRLIDADAWASAVRTARAGGTGWGINGPEEARG